MSPKQIAYLVFHSNMMMFFLSELNIWLSIYIMYQVFDALYINVVTNNEQSLKSTLAFVAKLECSSIIQHIVLLFSIPLNAKFCLGAPK